MQRFDGKTVLVTGGAHGIGLATARAFADEGASVHLMDLDGRRLADAVAELAGTAGGKAGGTLGDVCSRDDVELALAECDRTLGPVDICVNNAGYGLGVHTFEISESKWDEIVGVNLTGAFRVAQTVARRMVARGLGVILNTVSTSAIASEPGNAPYAAAKAGVLALTRVMACELARHSVRVCAVCPGDVDTYEWPNLELQRLYRLRIAAGRSARPDEVAAAFLYLASARVTGAVFVADGGMLAWE